MIKSYFILPKFRTTIFLVLGLPVLYFISRHNYNLFHSFADGVSIVIAACVFTIIWNGRRIVDNDYFLYVGIAFLFFAFWDLMHMLGNKNMGVFPEYGNLGPALYIVSRYILSISLMIAPLFINRKLNTTIMFALYSLITLFILLSIFYWHIFPICIVDGVGLTPFKVVSDYIICMILLVAIGLLIIKRRSFDSRVLLIIVSSLILSIATGLAFTLYADPFGIMNAAGHFFQIASFYLFFIAFIETSLKKPQDILYLKLKQKEEELVEIVKQSNNANVKLKQEVTERKMVEEELKISYKQIRSLASRLQEVREETRTNLSHDIHDELGGALAGLKMDLLRLELIASGEEDMKKRQAMLEIIHGSKELLNNTILATRRIFMEQRPCVLDDFGLVAAMEWQLEEYKTHSDISFEFNAEQIKIDMDKDFATVVFRIFQEALANVIRHSKATEVSISLQVDEGQLILEVKDNGRGITKDEITGKGSIGILGMRERALAFGGEINIAGEPGKGTILNLKIPVQ